MMDVLDLEAGAPGCVLAVGFSPFVLDEFLPLEWLLPDTVKGASLLALILKSENCCRRV